MQVRDNESLLNELPDLFERKFQHRLEPLLERYRLLAQAQQLNTASPEAEVVPLPLRADLQGQRHNIAA